MKVIPWTMIAFEQPTTKAYLENLYQNGYVFEKIIVLLHPKWFGQYNAMIQSRQKHLEEIADLIATHTKIKIPYFERLDFSKYSSNIEVIDEFQFYPDALLDALDPNVQYFFSYLGVVPERFLKKAKWLHVHGGLMPPLRGSVCMYWGLLYRGKPGYTLFWQTEKIDEGKILYQDESDEDLPDLSNLSKGIELETLRIGIWYFDLYVRSKLLVDYFNGGCQEKVYSHAQIKEFAYPDRVFFVEHKEIAKFCLTKFFHYNGWQD
ncbi:hypothetical protein CCZ01_08090 [Helicobacter monodelphidis]|uniref:hypothetical protein n=1 Tax=Helicobacter sp. 15-1451 TaxID=2004995 RepID=UPI000DCE8A15|nr:hypothetical protein [Helicobacter sp. 15-1451]RAX56890.1 hypothetical protein CCZ01_08090 [Helicobacter sp. 15-1451]